MLLYTGVDKLVLAREAKGSGEVINMMGCALDGKDDTLLQWIVDSGIVAICSDNIAIESLDLIRKDYPAIKLTLVAAQAQFVSDALSNLGQEIVLGAILSVLVILVFLRHFG